MQDIITEHLLQSTKYIGKRGWEGDELRETGGGSVRERGVREGGREEEGGKKRRDGGKRKEIWRERK